MTRATREVVGIVRGRDLHCASAQGGLHQLGVSDDRDARAMHRVQHKLA